MQSGRAARLQALSQWQAGAVVAAAGNGEVGEDYHVRALDCFVEVDGWLGRDL